MVEVGCILLPSLNYKVPIVLELLILFISQHIPAVWPMSVLFLQKISQSCIF